MTSHGELTVQIAKIISPILETRGYKVLYDHGVSSKNVGKIVSALERDYAREDELSQLDIAIVDQSDKAIVLVEIEETSGRPKTFLGDIFGVLFGNHVYFKHSELIVDESTSLVVVGVCKTDHPKRNQHIQDHVNQIKTILSTQNAAIGKVEIKIYSNEKELLKELPTAVDVALMSK